MPLNLQLFLHPGYGTRRWGSAVAFVFLLCAWLTGCGEPPVDDSLQRVLQRGKLIVGVDVSFMPMAFRDDDNRLTGFDVEFSREVCRRLGVECSTHPMLWKDKESELAGGHVDCVWSAYTITADREKSVAFSFPYLANRQVIAVPVDSPLRTLADLTGKTLGFQSGASVALDAVRNTPALGETIAGTVPFRDCAIALEDMETCGVDAVILDQTLAEDTIRRAGKPYRLLEEPLVAEDTYGVGFRPADVALRLAVEDQMRALAAEGFLSTLALKWFGEDLTVPPPATVSPLSSEFP